MKVASVLSCSRDRRHRSFYPLPLVRREFLRLLGAGTVGATVRPAVVSGPTGKPLAGIFPIAQTPFTGSGKLDVDTLAREVEFVNRAGAHGFVWPQMASEYTTLSESERIAGAEAILQTGKRLRAAIVIGVQADDAKTAAAYARHAERIGADAIIAIPPAKRDDDAALVDYYQAIGAASRLPLFVQAVGDMSVDLLLRLTKVVPAFRYVKDEAGSPLARIGPLRARSGDALKVFTGGHGITLLDELKRGASGSMPAAAFVDIYASVWRLWQAGKRREAMDLFGKALLLITEVQAYGIESLKYILQLRGIFPNHAVRSGKGSAPLDESGKQTLRDILEFVKPYLKA
ncbi:MAG: dihydrodipicolinate synthase family protein [Acidobacteriales bacterium]|nr:dihydrodipicolinate synthase family protein [Terriglobales bacterium]